MWTCLKFWPMKKIFQNYMPVRVWLWFVYKFTENNCRLRLFSEFIQIYKRQSYLSWQNTYPYLKTTCHIKLTFFLWTKLLENLPYSDKFWRGENLAQLVQNGKNCQIKSAPNLIIFLLPQIKSMAKKFFL